MNESQGHTSTPGMKVSGTQKSANRVSIDAFACETHDAPLKSNLQGTYRRPLDSATATTIFLRFQGGGSLNEYADEVTEYFRTWNEITQSTKTLGGNLWPASAHRGQVCGHGEGADFLRNALQLVVLVNDGDTRESWTHSQTLIVLTIL
jgi:hypothetical protein